MSRARPFPSVGSVRRPALLFAGFLGAMLACGAARAQIVLPGASTPGAAAAAAAAGAGPATGEPGKPAPPKRKPAPPKTFSEDALVGRDLQRNGSKGRMSIAKAGGGSYTVRLIAVGEKLSKPAEACGLDLGNGQPLAMAAQGKPDGVPRYSLDVPGCALTLDIADQSVLVQGEAACTFAEADCRVDPRGLWGPPPADLESKAGALENDRSRADKAARETFKVLMKRTKDKAQLKALVSEQAGFTAERDMTCRDYAREPAHGFCGARYTELRAASLEARRARMEASGQLAAPKPKPKPKPAVATTPAAQPAASPLQ